MICAPSGGGKTILLQNMILDIYRDCFERIYISSPSIDIDHTWKPVKDYIQKEIKPHEKEQIYFDPYQPEELQEIIKRQHRVADYLKSNNINKLFQILIVIDDFADDPQFTRNSKLLHQLYIRGRHQCISTITSTQVYKAISPIVRKIWLICLYTVWGTKPTSWRSSRRFRRSWTPKPYTSYTRWPPPSHTGSYIYKPTGKEYKDMFYMNFDRPLVVKQ